MTFLISGLRNHHFTNWRSRSDTPSDECGREVDKEGRSQHYRHYECAGAENGCKRGIHENKMNYFL